MALVGPRRRTAGVALAAALALPALIAALPAARAELRRTLWLEGLAHGHHLHGRHPLAVVHATPSLAREGPLDLVVVFHGWNSCASMVMGELRPPCRRDGGNLTVARQLDATGLPVLGIVPQLAFEQRTTDPGRFALHGELSRFLDDVLAHSEPLVGARTLADVRTIVLASHSAGYSSLAAALRSGTPPQVRAIVLLDSLYGQLDTFAEFGRDEHRRVFVVAGSQTRAGATALAERFGVRVQAARSPSRADLTGRVAVVLSPIGHEQIARAFLGPIVREVLSR